VGGGGTVVGKKERSGPTDWQGNQFVYRSMGGESGETVNNQGAGGGGTTQTGLAGPCFLDCGKKAPQARGHNFSGLKKKKGRVSA